MRSGSGVADARIQAAFESLAAAKVPITPAKLATRALTGYPTALRWLKIHHPDLLVPKPEAPKPDSVPAEQAKTTTQAKTAQKLPEVAPKKRVAAKAQPLPKKLRNPKNYPELLGTPEGAHAKTAPVDHGTQTAQKPAKRLRNPGNEPF